MARSMTNINGNAAATEAVCNALSPPESNNAAAKSAWTTPHKLSLLGRV